MMFEWPVIRRQDGRPGCIPRTARSSSPPRSPGCWTWCHPTTGCTGCCAGIRWRWPPWRGTTPRRASRARARVTARRGPSWAARCRRTRSIRCWPPTGRRGPGWPPPRGRSDWSSGPCAGRCSRRRCRTSGRLGRKLQGNRATRQGRRRVGGRLGREDAGGVGGTGKGAAGWLDKTGRPVATRRPHREIMVSNLAGGGCRPGAARRSGPVSRQARILLVDDRPENLVALDAILSSLNQILVPVRSGEQAIAAVLADEYAVVLLDIMMPGMDGFETATQIKRHAKSRDVPIIFLTAATMQPEQAFRGYAAGAVDYLAKPFDPWVLKSKVSVFVDLYLKRSASALDHLSAGLGAVEETVALLRRLPAVLRDAEAKEAAAQLAGRIGRLRDALEAFGSGAA